MLKVLCFQDLNIIGLDTEKLTIIKIVGKIANLEFKLKFMPWNTNIGEEKVLKLIVLGT